MSVLEKKIASEKLVTCGENFVNKILEITYIVYYYC